MNTNEIITIIERHEPYYRWNGALGHDERPLLDHHRLLVGGTEGFADGRPEVPLPLNDWREVLRSAPVGAELVISRWYGCNCEWQGLYIKGPDDVWFLEWKKDEYEYEDEDEDKD